MSQTDPRAVALAEDCKAQDPRAAKWIAHALADAERRGLERAATVVQSLPFDPAVSWGHATIVGYILDAIRAQAREART